MQNERTGGIAHRNLFISYQQNKYLHQLVGGTKNLHCTILLECLSPSQITTKKSSQERKFARVKRALIAQVWDVDPSNGVYKKRLSVATPGTVSCERASSVFRQRQRPFRQGNWRLRGRQQGTDKHFNGANRAFWVGPKEAA